MNELTEINTNNNNTPKDWLTTASKLELQEAVLLNFLSPVKLKTKDEIIAAVTNINNNFTSTTELNRKLLKIFQYTDRPVYYSSREIYRFEYENKEYAITISGSIGMNHKELLDIIIYSAQEKAIIDKKLAIKTKLYTVKKAFDFQKSSYYTNLLKDLKTAQLFISEIDKNNKYTRTRPFDGLIHDFEITESNRHKFKESLDLKIVLSNFLTNCFYIQMPIYYDPFAIYEFKWGINKAIISYLKSHKQNSIISYSFDTLYKHIGIEYNVIKKEKKNWNHRIKQESDIYLKNGFFVDKQKNQITNATAAVYPSLPQTQQPINS